MFVMGFTGKRAAAGALADDGIVFLGVFICYTT